MATAVYNFIGDVAIQQGATFLAKFIWKDSNSVPIDLTGYTARMQIRATITSTVVIAELTTTTGITLGGTTGNIELKLTATQTAAITAKVGVYDLELQDTAGFVTRLISGDIEFSHEVTR